jgi:hypothetical protein
VIDRLLRTVSAHDLDAAPALFATDYRSAQPAHPGRAFVGRDQMRANWAAMFAGIPDFHAELVRSVDDGPLARGEWHWSGTRTDGQAFGARGVIEFEISDGLIAAGRLYGRRVDAVGLAHEYDFRGWTRRFRVVHNPRNKGFRARDPTRARRARPSATPSSLRRLRVSDPRARRPRTARKDQRNTAVTEPLRVAEPSETQPDDGSRARIQVQAWTNIRLSHQQPILFADGVTALPTAQAGHG